MNRNPYVSAATIKMAEALELLDKGKVHGPSVDRLREAVKGLHDANGRSDGAQSFEEMVRAFASARWPG